MIKLDIHTSFSSKQYLNPFMQRCIQIPVKHLRWNVLQIQFRDSKYTCVTHRKRFTVYNFQQMFRKTAQKKQFFIKDFFKNCKQICWNCGFVYIYQPIFDQCPTYVETRQLVLTSKIFEKHLWKSGMEVDDLHLYLKCHFSTGVFQTFCQ